jgi:hypothetical protein
MTALKPPLSIPRPKKCQCIIIKAKRWFFWPLKSYYIVSLFYRQQDVLILQRCDLAALAIYCVSLEDI